MVDDLQLAIFAAGGVCVRRVSGDAGSEKARYHRPGKIILIAVNIAKLPSVPRQILKDIPRPPNTASRDD
jgi:hypothetical protein